MKVWKSVGAVAVYSRPRAAAVVGGSALVLAGAGVGVGLAIANDDSGGGVPASATAPTDATTRTARPDAAPQPATATIKRHVRAAEKRAYNRGYDAGAKSTNSGISGLGSGGPYVVRVARSADGTLKVIQAIPVQNGKTYWLCQGGSRLCFH